MREVVRGRAYPDQQPIEIILDNGIIQAKRQIAVVEDLPWLVPGFIDNHCHILPAGLFMQRVDLGECQSHEEVIEKLRHRAASTEPGRWILATNYDQNKYDGGHMHRSQLDQASLKHPIQLRHVNGHAGVANSLALQVAGVNSSTPDPRGGAFVRDSSGELTGVLLETAHEAVDASIPKPTQSEMVDAIVAACDQMKTQLLVGASDMQTGRYNLEDELHAYRIASEISGFPMRLYLQWSTMFGPRAMDPGKLRELTNAMNPELCRVAGIKIFADGALGSRTAAIYGQFQGSDQQSIDEGTLIYPPDRLRQMVKVASDAGYQVSVHAIGDRASDLVMDAFESTDMPSRHRLEHAMMLSDAQIERLANIGCHVTMQPEFLTRFKHTYLKNLGPERAASLFRFRSVSEAGIRLSLSSDRPIVAGHALDTIEAAVNRPEGYDPAECLPLSSAALGLWSFAAEANEDSFPSPFEPKTRAQFNILKELPALLSGF
ncbi:MAG: amidohydrolase [Armatimonadetes bacterium]|nr:amidohydrolase [Armatimonadota bacterium]